MTPPVDPRPALATANSKGLSAQPVLPGVATSLPEVVSLAPVESDRFEDRFDDLAAIAYRVTFRLLGSRQDAEDLTQETLTRAFQRWRRVRGHAEPWVARVASNLALDQIRRGKRRPVVSSSGHDDHPAPHSPSVDDRLELVSALQGLSRRQREVVVLRYLADLAEADVARELGISVGSVKKHASRGLAALRGHGDAAPAAVEPSESARQAPGPEARDDLSERNDDNKHDDRNQSGRCDQGDE